MTVEANSDGEYDHFEAAARDKAVASVEVISVDDDDEEQRDHQQQKQQQQKQQEEDEQGQEEEDEDEDEYDYDAAVAGDRDRQAAERKAARMAAAGDGGGGDDDDDDMQSVESNYSYEMSDGEAEDTTQGKDLAVADADAFEEATDGMFAKVEAPSAHLVRLWICVKPWRLYEGLGSRTVEALGLDPERGVTVMLTTDQYYTLSSKCPEVKWLRQVHPDRMNHASLTSDGSIGDSFPLQWMLRKRLEEELSQHWPPRSHYPDSDDDDEMINGGGGGHQAGGAGAAGGGVVEDRHSSEVTRFAIEAICECTGVSTELAAYALQFSQFDEQLAQNNLLDEDTRLSLEMTLTDDREAAMAELRKTFPYLDEVVIRHAVTSHPGALHLQRNYVCRVETGEQQIPTSSASTPDAATSAAAVQQQQPPQQQQQQPAAAAAATSGAGGANSGSGGGGGGGGGGVTGRLRRWGRATRKRSPPVSSPSEGKSKSKGKGKGKRKPSSTEPRPAESSQGCGGGGGGGAARGGRRGTSRGWQGAGEFGFMPVDLTEDEEREDRRAILEHLSHKNMLLRVAHTVIDKLRNANKRCLVCDDMIQGFLPAVPIVCPKDLCVMSSEDMGCGTDVESQVAKKGETVDLLIDLFWMAMAGGSRTELAFPENVQYGKGLAFKKRDGRHDTDKVKEVLGNLPSVAEMQKCIERKKKNRGGGISEGLSRTEVEESGGTWNPTAAGSDVATLNAAAAQAAQIANNAAANYQALLRSKPNSASVAKAKEDARKKADAASNAAARAVAAGAGAGGGGGGGGGALMERSPLAYLLLRWLLSANRAHLRPLEKKELIPEIPCEKQFMLVTGTADRETRFQTMKRREAMRTGGTGSFYAFHGSKPNNWHGILHMGLRNMSGTKYMSTGQAYGSGIYMADQLQVSLTYAGVGGTGPGSSHWPLSSSGSNSTQAVIVAVCEVIDKEENRKTHGPKYFVIPEEESVATRFLLINPTLSVVQAATISASNLTIGTQR
eukprot:g19426.t1